jgi:hypothetical protein
MIIFEEEAERKGRMGKKEWVPNTKSTKWEMLVDLQKRSLFDTPCGGKFSMKKKEQTVVGKVQEEGRLLLRLLSPEGFQPIGVARKKKMAN